MSSRPADPLESSLLARQPSLAGASPHRTVRPELAETTAPPPATAPPSVGALRGVGIEEGELEVTRELGRGGMGRVLLGKQRSLGREVALKTLRPDRETPEHAASLIREGRTAGALEHPGIVPVHALGRGERGQPVLVMKRVDGVELGRLLKEPEHEGWRWLERATGAADRISAGVEVLVRVASALEFAHSNGVLHRDIKPDNVMIGRFGEVYLVDWGVALPLDEALAAQRSGEVAGTPAYMAPEMILPEVGPPSLATDVYLLGATLHEILTGQPRHGGRGLGEVLASAAASAPVAYPPEVPAELGELCNAATARDPAARPPTAAAFREALLGYLRHAGAVRLGREALGRLAKLTELLALPPEQAPPRAVHRAGDECRFAFALALRDWPDNAEARRGREECLSALASFELARGDPDDASELIEQMASPPAPLRERAAALVEQRRRERAQAEALLRQAREQDPSVGAGLRAALLGALVLWVVLAGGALHLLEASGHAVTLAMLMAGHAAQMVLVLLLIGLLRRRLLRNEANRVLLRVAVGGMGLTLLHRIFALRAGLPLASVLSNDQLIAAAALWGAGAALGWHLIAPAAVLLVGALLCTARPGQALAVFSVSMFVCLLGVLLGTLAQRSRPTPAGPEAPRG